MDLETDDFEDYQLSPPNVRRIEDPAAEMPSAVTPEQVYIDAAAGMDSGPGSPGGQGEQGEQGAQGPPISTDTFTARVVVIVSGTPTTGTKVFYTPP